MNKYTYEQVLNASMDYFGGDELAAKVFVDKYALQNSIGEYLELTPKDMHKRLAKEFARIEMNYPNPMSEDEIFILLDGFKYVVPQGSPMSAIGNPFQIQSLSNCFVVESPYDSYAGILKTDQELAQISKRRGGVGLSISTLRPKNMPTANAAKTTDGIGVFMERFSNTIREVGQNGRRGALMITCSVHHPEVRTFINIKRDLKKVTGANISLQISDEFMNAVKNKQKYQLRWPVDAKEPLMSEYIDASEVWNEIIEAAHGTAEPGILFWDTALRRTPSDIYTDIGYGSISTNPCQPAWATLLSPSGITTMGDIKIGDIVWSGKQWTKVVNKACTGKKDVYAYRTRAGTFYGTENHRVVSNGKKIEAKDAESIDISYVAAPHASINKQEDTKFNRHIMDGLVIGDGMIHKASNNKVLLCIGANDHDYFTSEISSLIVENREGISKHAWDIDTDIKHYELPKTYDRRIPNRYKFGDFNTRRAFLRGLYSANGSIVTNRVNLKSSSFMLIEDVQQMLSSLGIPSYYTVNKAHKIEFENGTYECKESYNLNIGTLDGRKQFASLIGFLHEYKMKKLLNSLDTQPSYKPFKSTYDIVEREFICNEKVYDITVEADEHTYWTGGLLVSNCAELILSKYDSCRLLLLNLTSYVKNPYTKKSEFNYELFVDHAKKAQRLMDDMIDLEVECIDKIISKIEADPEPINVKSTEFTLWKEIRNACTNGRRTGTGITGLGDCLAMLGMKYGAEQSIFETENIYKHLAIGCYRSTCELAGERGAFPVFSFEKEKGHEFLEQIWQADTTARALYEKNGRRNIALLTTAPTGSVSTQTQTTSGIEPAYLLEYKRRKKINHGDKNAIVDFTDQLGDKWQEFKVYHHGVKKWMNATGETDITKSPYHGATSNEIDWLASVKLQGVAQKWTCHAISKTCNLPNSVSKDLVAEVYMKAWEAGCKGFTVYRDGCRTGVLISEETHKQQSKKDERPSNIENSFAPKRQDALPCDIRKVKIQGEQWTMFIGILDGRPYEIFGGLSKYVDIPNKYKTGKIVKNGKVDGLTTYNLVIGDGDDQMTLKDIANVFDNANYGAFTRTISLSLRHGVPVQFVVEQLQKDKHSDITSFSKVVARVLKQYISDNTEVAAKKCPSCNKDNTLAYQEGCLRCTDPACGFSKCG